MKIKFENPCIEVILLGKEDDIITTSVNVEEDFGGDIGGEHTPEDWFWETGE